MQGWQDTWGMFEVAAMQSGSVGSSVVKRDASNEPIKCSCEGFTGLREGFDGLTHAKT